MSRSDFGSARLASQQANPQPAHSPLFEEPEQLREIMRVDVLMGATGLADRE